MASKAIDKNEVISVLNKNYLMHSKWHRCLMVRLGYKRYSILNLIINAGRKCIISRLDFAYMLSMDKDMFGKYRDELANMKVFTFKKGTSNGRATEYFKSNERIAELIIEGNELLLNRKLDIIAEDNIYDLPRQNQPSFKLNS